MVDESAKGQTVAPRRGEVADGQVVEELVLQRVLRILFEVLDVGSAPVEQVIAGICGP